jgi:hypothetical protein
MDAKGMQPWMRFLLIAAVVAFAGTIAVHIYDCQTGTREQCLMSRGLLWVYWIGFFVVVGVPVATIEQVVRRALAKWPRE